MTRAKCSGKSSKSAAPGVPRIVLSRAARRDLVEIFEYGEAEFGAAAADAYNDEIEERFDRLVDHPLNSRVVALPPDKLRGIPCVVIASGGRAKAEALRGALKGGMCNVIVTDEQTARAILAMDQP